MERCPWKEGDEKWKGVRGRKRWVKMEGGRRGEG